MDRSHKATGGRGGQLSEVDNPAAVPTYPQT